MVDRPSRDLRYDPDIGWRVTPAGTAVCVHPYRVGLPAGRYATAATPVPDPYGQAPTPVREALELPDDLEDLEGWLVAVLRVEPDQEMLFGAVRRAEQAALRRFPPGAVVTAMRRVLSVELARR